MINETPYINLRNNAHGTRTIDYTQADIIEGIKPHDAAARSYNTIIGVYTRTNDGQKVYLETSGIYSTTTATKHKPRAARLASYNGYEIVTGIKPETLHNLYFYDKYDVSEILQEAKLKNEILETLKSGHDNGPIIHGQVIGVINSNGTPKTTDYKNGNRDVKYFYKTNFKHVTNIKYEQILKSIPVKINKGQKGQYLTHDYKSYIVNIKEV